MRFVVFLFGLIASLMTAVAGVGLAYWDTSLAVGGEGLLAGVLDLSSTTSMTGVAYPNAGLVLIVAALYGFLGAIFALARCGKQGACLMIVPVLLGAFLQPWSLILTSTQFFTGLMSLLVGPPPIEPATTADDAKKDDAKKNKGKDADDDTDAEADDE